MRQPPSPLLLSARKRRPRRTPPRGAQPRDLAAAPAQFEPAESSAPTTDTERCALVQPFPEQGARGRGHSDKDSDDTPFE